MIKLYKEHPEFDEYTEFDTETGRLSTIAQEEFERFLPDNLVGNGPIQRIVRDDKVLFLGETPETHVRFPRRIYFQITRNCNLKCPFCFIKAESGHPDVPTDRVFDVAKFMGKNGLMEARLTGGEPTVHPDILAIINKFHEEGVYVSLATNGIWSKRTLDALCEMEYLWVICSVDGNRMTHNKYRPGTFDKIIANLRELKERKPLTRIRLTTVLTNENKRQMYELGKICNIVGAESITVIPLRPQVRDPGIRSHMVSGNEFRHVIEDLIRAKEELGVSFTTTMETDYKEKIYRDPIVRKRSSCAAGREATNLDYDVGKGEFVVYACSYSPASDLGADPAIRAPFLAGTFRDVGAFLHIWREEDAWRIYRDLSIRSKDCLECEYLARHQCTGSCPIQNIDLTRVDVSRNVLDQLKEQIRQTGEWYCYRTLD